MNLRTLSTSIATLCAVAAFLPTVHSEEVIARPINLIINKKLKTGEVPDPDAKVIGEFGYNMLFSAKVSATKRRLFYKPMRKKDRTGIDPFVRPIEVADKHFPLKAGKYIKGDIDNYVYEENVVNDNVGVAFFHEAGNGIFRAGSTSRSSSIQFLKRTDTDKTGLDPEQMASGLSILDWDGKFPEEVIDDQRKNFVYPYLLFAAPDKKHGKELWLSDGTAAGTKFFMDINTSTTPVMNPKNHRITQAPNGSNIQPISTYFGELGSSTSFGGSAYFSAQNADGYDVYRVDSIENAPKRTPRVTVFPLFKTFYQLDLVSQPTNVSATPSGVFFTLPTSSSNGLDDVWGYDPQNLQQGPLVASSGFGTIAPTNTSYRSGFRAGDEHGYYFSGIQDVATGREPLMASIDVNGPEISSLGDLVAGTGASNPKLFTEAGLSLFFVATLNGVDHLFRTNTTPNGYEDLGAFANVRDITPVVDFSTSQDESGSRIYFVADDDTGTPVLWYSTLLSEGDTGIPIKVLTATGKPVKNPTTLRRLVGNGCWYLFFACDGAGTEYETITPTKGTPFPAGRQVWYTGEFFDNNP